MPAPPKTPLSRHRAFYTGTITFHLIFMILCYLLALETGISKSTCRFLLPPSPLPLNSSIPQFLPPSPLLTKKKKKKKPSINAVPTAITLTLLAAIIYAVHDKRGIFRGSLEKYG